MDRILARIRNWRTGNPLDPKNHLGALIDSDHCKKIASYLKEQSPVTGGKLKGNFLEPTVYIAKRDDKISREEIFGPVLSVIAVESLDEAIEIANDTDYGLTASIFTAHATRAMTTARAIKAGTVTINCYGEGDITTPFGGYKQSGFGGRDNGLQAHDQYTELKTIWIDLSDPADQDGVV